MGSRTRIYLDHNATTPLWAEARRAMEAAMGGMGNPSSPHAEGRRARALVDKAREQVAELMGVSALNVVFTGGGAEANALAVAQAECLGARRLLIGAGEHACVLAAAEASALPCRMVGLDEDGRLDLRDLEAALGESSDEVPFLACMLANNETGVMQPVVEAAGLVRGAGGFVHCDAVQGVGRMPVFPAALGVDFCALSAHKMGGPSGVGALVCLRETDVDAPRFVPLVGGGGQERGWRAGTENVIGIVGFGAAAGASFCGGLRAPHPAFAEGGDFLHVGGKAPHTAHHFTRPPALLVRDSPHHSAEGRAASLSESVGGEVPEGAASVQEAGVLHVGGKAPHTPHAFCPPTHPFGPGLAATSGAKSAPPSPVERLPSGGGEGERLASLRDELEKHLRGEMGAVIFGERAERMSHVSCFAIPGLAAETAVMRLDLAGIAVGAGSACSSGKLAPSHVLAAMGVSPDLARCALRVSLGRGNRRGDVARLIECLAAAAKEIKN